MHELISPTVNFAIFVLGLGVLLRKPLREMIASRHEAIKKNVQESETQRKEAQKKYQEFTSKLTTFEAEANQVVERARQEGESLKNKIIRDAQANAERIVRDAEATVQANLQDYKDQIRRETIDRAVEMAEKIIRERLSTDDQKRIVTEYVGKVQ